MSEGDLEDFYGDSYNDGTKLKSSSISSSSSSSSSSFSSSSSSSSSSSLGMTSIKVQEDDLFGSLESDKVISDSPGFEPFDGVIDSDGKNLLGGEKRSISDTPPEDLSIWSLGFYQQFFDVTTYEILGRVAKSVMPLPTTVPFFATGEEKPDLYAPFWICTTLIFLLAAAGNFAEYLNFSPQYSTQVWKYDFEKVTLAATMFYCSLVVWPVMVFLALRHINVHRSFVTIISLYGYSFSSYLISCILCLIPGALWSTLSITASFAVSMAFIGQNLWHMMQPVGGEDALDDENLKYRYFILGFVSIVHLGIALSTKLYFFSN